MTGASEAAAGRERAQHGHKGETTATCEGRGGSSYKAGGALPGGAGSGAVRVTVHATHQRHPWAPASRAMSGDVPADPEGGAEARDTPGLDGSFKLGQSIVPVLNNPNYSGAGSGGWGWPWQSASDTAYRSEGPPPLAPGVLPEVEPADFLKYLRAISDKYRQFRSLYGPDSEGVREAGAPKHGEVLVSAMQQVPNIFFQEDFALERPEIYVEVNPDDTEVGRMERVEELTSYMDVIERSLLKEIGVRSGSFFEATGLLQDLEAVIRLASAQIRELRGSVSELDEKMLQIAVQVQNLNRRRANLLAVVEKLKVVERVMNAQTALQLLLPQGNFSAVLDVLDEFHSILEKGEVAGLAAFRHLDTEIAEAEEAVNTLMAAEFLQEVALTQLDQIVQSAIAGELRTAVPDASTVPELNRDDEELHPIVQGLLRTGQLGPVLANFKNACVVDMKRAIRSTVENLLPILFKDQGAESDVSNLAASLQLLSHDNFMRLLCTVKLAVQQCLQHVVRVKGIVVGGLEHAKVLRSRQASSVKECTEAVNAAAEAAHGRWAKLLNARMPVLGFLSLEQFHAVIRSCTELISVTESLGARSGGNITGIVQQQARAYLEGMHSAKLTNLTHLLDKETWVAAEFSPAHEAMLAQLLSQPATGITENRVPGNAGIDTHSDEAVDQATITFNERRFHLPGSVLNVIEMLSEYMKFASEMPAFASSVAHRVVELLKVFNSRSCQLVLGAGAMQVAGLKSITAKHLALSCQSLGLFIACLPDLQSALSRGIPEHHKALLAPEMSRLLQDLSLHREEIYAKLVAIMRERLITGARQLPQLADTWGSGSTKPKATIFAESTAKQLRVLRGVLVPLMNEADLTAVFGRISALFGTTLAETYGRLEPMEDKVAWEAQRKADTLLMLQALQELPVQKRDLRDNLQPLQSFCKRYSKSHDPGNRKALATEHNQAFPLETNVGHDLASESTGPNDPSQAAEELVQMPTPNELLELSEPEEIMDQAKEADASGDVSGMDPLGVMTLSRLSSAGDGRSQNLAETEKEGSAQGIIIDTEPAEVEIGSVLEPAPTSDDAADGSDDYLATPVDINAAGNELPDAAALLAQGDDV